MHVNFVAAAAQEALMPAGSGSGEIWSDGPVLATLQQGVEPAAASPAERKRIK
jgi:hypothetical protein